MSEVGEFMEGWVEMKPSALTSTIRRRGGAGPIFIQEKFKSEKWSFQENRGSPEFMFWGWLPVEQMDGWYLHLDSVINPGTESWSQQVLPSNWDGSLAQICSDGGLERGMVVGSFGNQMDGGFWVAPFQMVAAPAWPRLGKGETMERKAREMHLLGVMRLGWTTKYPKKGELMLAWADKAGKFLGWEKIEDMGEARNIPREAVRQLRPLGGFEQFEQDLRESSWGREL